MTKAIGFIYYVSNDKGIETIDIIAETPQSYFLSKDDGTEYVILKEMVTSDIKKNHLKYTFSYKFAKKRLEHIVNVQALKIEEFRKQLLKD